MTKSCVKFSGKDGRKTVHFWPSNFFIEPDGTNVEAEFQAAKHQMFGNPFVAAHIRTMKPNHAKYWGSARKFPLNKRDLALWHRYKREIMKDLVRQKFEDHDELRDQLLATSEGLIVEENWWHDDVWGHCTCRDHYWKIGQNWLGYILMELRQEFGGVGFAKRTWGNFDPNV